MTRETPWQPIETAPRDGTQILVWRMGHLWIASWRSYWTLEDMRWVVRQPDSSRPAEAGSVISIGPPTELETAVGISGPTHWMPLPDPPTEDSAS